MPSLRGRRRKKRGTGWGELGRKARNGGEKGRGRMLEELVFLYSAHHFLNLSDNVNCQYMTNHKWWGISAWSELNYFVYRKLSSRDAFFNWYRNRAKQNVFTVLAPAANTTNIDYEQSLFSYCSQSEANNIWSVSCELTKSLFLPHQTKWSQRTDQSPAWDPNNERRIINYC